MRVATMTSLPLFSKKYEDVDWDRVLRITQGTALDGVLQDLLKGNGSYMNGWRTWRGDWRKRVSDLRAMGIPIQDRRDSTTMNQNEYALPPDFIKAYYDHLFRRLR